MNSSESTESIKDKRTKSTRNTQNELFQRYIVSDGNNRLVKEEIHTQIFIKLDATDWQNNRDLKLFLRKMKKLSPLLFYSIFVLHADKNKNKN